MNISGEAPGWFSNEKRRRLGYGASAITAENLCGWIHGTNCIRDPR